MTKITLTDLANLQNETTAVNAINANNAVLKTASDNTLSRDGTQPNAMNATLDMNSQQIINLPVPSSNNSPARLIDVVSNPTIVVPGTGTSGHVVGYLDTSNTTSGNNVHSGTETFNGAITSNAGITASNLIVTSGITVPNNTITNAELATVPINTAKGSVAGGTPTDLTKTQLTTLVNPVTSALSGAAPASGGGTTNFLRADATWAVPPASAMTLIETLTPSGVATSPTTVLWTSTYSSYEIYFINVIPATTSVTFEMQIHAAAAYQTATYITTTAGWSNGSATILITSPTTFIPLTTATAVLNTGGGVSGYIRIPNPAGTSVPKCIHGLISYQNPTFTGFNNVSGAWNNATAIDGAQFLFSSGNIASGTIKIYGIT